MAKPAILTVDDDIQVLNAIERDLRQRYRSHYRVLKAGSGPEALELLVRLSKRNDPVALLLVDQRMPEMNGTEFIKEALKLFPDVKKVLLTAYSDTNAAIESINKIGLDYYLLKPWDPPDLNLYPILDDLLSDWLATVPLPFEGIRVAGTLWSATSHDVKDFLARNRIPYQWLDIEHDTLAHELVEKASPGDARLPVVFFPDGDILVQPTIHTLAAKAGLQTQASQKTYDLIIIGAGPAGLGAAVYSGSEGLRTALIEREATGGQAGTSSRIENYLGFPQGVSGWDLARRATDQARRFGVEILSPVDVVKVRVEEPYKYALLSDGTEISSRAMIIAAGVTVRRLEAPGVEQLTGAGIYYGAAVSEAAHYREKHVFVIGGANSAGQGAVFLSRYAQKVTMVVRSSSLAVGMSQYLINQIVETNNIQVITNTEVSEACGDRYLESLILYNKQSDENVTHPADAMFIFVGAVPHTEMVAGIVVRNRAGFILTGTDLMVNGERPKNWTLKRDPYLLETSVPGIFAVGDVRQGAVRRVASAVGEGAVAISLIHQYLNTV